MIPPCGFLFFEARCGRVKARKVSSVNALPSEPCAVFCFFLLPKIARRSPKAAPAIRKASVKKNECCREDLSFFPLADVSFLVPGYAIMHAPLRISLPVCFLVSIIVCEYVLGTKPEFHQNASAHDYSLDFCFVRKRGISIRFVPFT